MMKNKNRLQWYGAAVFLLLALASCQVKRPDGVFSDAEMENVLYDYHIAKAMGEGLPYNENYKRVLYVEAVYRKYGITEAQFDSSMTWFARNPEVLSQIYENINTRLKAEKESLETLIAQRDNKPRTSKPGDSIDVWGWQRLYQLSGMPMDNKITFVLPADSNFQDRDTLRWNVHFAFQGTGFDSLSAPVMAMQIHYKNDSIVGDIRRILSAGDHSLTLQGDTLGAIEEVTGFVYYPRQAEQRALLLNRISLMRYHCTDTTSVAAKDTLKTVSGEQPETVVETDSVKDKPADMGKPSSTPRVRPRPSAFEEDRKVQKQPVARPVQNKPLKLNNRERNPRRQ